MNVGEFVVHCTLSSLTLFFFAVYVFSKALCEPKAIEAGPGHAHSTLLLL